MLFGTRPGCIVALIAAFFVVGCAGSYRTTTKNGHEKVYRTDEGGHKTLVYEIEDGELTVHDESDPRGQKMLEAHEQEKQWQALETERVAQIKEAPKRAANDPIRVALHRLEVSDNLRKAQHTEKAIEEQFRGQFAGDKIIRLVAPAVTGASEFTKAFAMVTGQAPTKAVSAGPAADVEVSTRAYVEERVGYNKSSKKLGTYGALVYEATIKSNYLPAEYTVSEEGNIFRNVEVTKRLAEKIKDVIKREIGPTIPADRKL